MTAFLNGVDAHVAIPAHHVLENGFGQQVRSLSADHENGHFDGVPVFPEVYAVMPGVSKGVGNVRVGWRGAKEEERETLQLVDYHRQLSLEALSKARQAAE